MTPSAQPADTAPAGTLVPEQVLQDGEVVLLAVKPSGWFVLLVSWPVVLAAGVIAGAAALAEWVWAVGSTGPAIPLFCLAVALLRLVVASFQWLGRVYVLTNTRLMRIRGVLKVDVFQCQLRRVTGVVQAAGRGEKLLGLGSLLFEADEIDTREGAWLHLARPSEVRKVVEEAVARARKRP